MALIHKTMDDHVVITEYVAEEGSDTVCIPKQIDGLPVTEIGPEAFCHKEGLTTVIIPMTLERIGKGAFAGCQDLICVGVRSSEDHSVFPSGLGYVGEEAFLGTALKTVSFTAPQMELDRECFLNSRVREVIFLAADVILRKGAFQGSDIRVLTVNEGQIAYLEDFCFAFCEALQAVRAISVGGVGKNCFLGCENLEALSVKLPLDRVGEGAFRGCGRLETHGFFRNMYDAIISLGVEYMVNQALEMRYPASSWLPRRFGRDHFRSKNAAARVVEKIKNTPRLPSSNFMLLNATGTEYNDPDDWDYVNRFSLYEKDEIIIRFRNISQWDLIGDSWACMEPPYRYIGDLSREEVDRALKFKNGPKSVVMDWDDLTLLLNAELGGDTAVYHNGAVIDFISGLIDHEEGNTPQGYREMPHKNLDMLTGEEVLHYLTWDVLYNRIALYTELKHAYNQLTCKAE